MGGKSQYIQEGVLGTSPPLEPRKRECMRWGFTPLKKKLPLSKQGYQRLFLM
jgi:hypothetical protein